MGSWVAPWGTATVSEVVVATVTLALTAPKKTMLLEGVLLKFVPVIVTVVPTAPVAGAKELRSGCACSWLKNRKIIR